MKRCRVSPRLGLASTYNAAMLVLSVVVAFFYGALLGSFAGVLAFRIPRGLSFVTPGSFCTECGHGVRWYDNIPVLSFALLGGECRTCLAPISIRHPMMELVSGLFAAGCVFRFGVTPEAALFIVLGIYLVALFQTDMDLHTLPDELTVSGTVVGLLAGLAAQLGWIKRTRGAASFPEAALGLTAGAGLLLGIMFLYQTIRDRPGMGVGDVKLMALVGSFFGLKLTVATLFGSVFLGAAGGILFIAWRGGNLQTALPFGTYVAAAATLVLFFYMP